MVFETCECHFETLETMMTYKQQPCILEPTRLVAGNKPSLIDNIFVNTIEKEVFSGNLMSKLSDHLPQFIFVKNINKPKKRHRVVKDFSNFDETSYKADLHNINFNSCHKKDTESLFNDFHRQYINIINKHIPNKTLSIKEFTWRQKPWVTTAIQRKINQKNKCNAKFVRTNHPFWYEQYKILTLWCLIEGGVGISGGVGKFPKT